ncbi:MAG TPA: autotransporter-associated beta strand repeat-containing protein, partial [Candidatus Sulfotelmatobacter sp.]|nr:autotransporter-associated beta strand repeat-containing protein [Candidatus Sulfotelmatobacter sp.]
NYIVTPNVLVTNAGSLAVGTYPLIKYSGTSSGTAPTSVTLPVSGYCSGYVSNSATAKTLYLVITSSSVSANLAWGTCIGNWDFTTPNWTSNGVSVVYNDGKAVQFDDTAPCTSPIVTLNTNVAPSGVVFNNITNSFAIAGSGNINISPGGDLELLGGGMVALSATNTYSGGTVVSAGSLLNINNGGSGSGSPIGTGTLTLNGNARLGNTSGSAVVLQYPVPQVWNGNFSFAGSNDLNLGTGSVTMPQNTTVNIVTNNLTIGGSISDGGAGNQLIKTGNGTLTLAGNNSWSGVQLQAGQISLVSPAAIGSGSASLTISGGAMDNVSGSDMALPLNSSYNINTAGNTFTVVGSGNLDFSSAPIIASISGFNVNVVSNTWITDGISLNNAHATKTGNGTWKVIGSDTGITPGNITVNQGVLDMARGSGATVVGGGGGSGSHGGFPGLIVNSNALVLVDGFNEIGTSWPVRAATPVEVTLNTGVLDVNGHDLSADLLALNNGILRNSVPGSGQLLNILATNQQALYLAGTNCQFDVPPVDATLYINALATGSGTLVKTGAGTLEMLQSNVYTGNITVSAGTLNLSYPDIAAGATVTLAGGTNAMLNLSFANSDTNTVAGLVLGGVPAAAGLHNATTDPTYITGSGSLLVNPITINPLPGTIQFSVSVSTLNLAWPTNGGWLLQAQTNSLQSGLGTNWVVVAGSDSITNLSIPINQANGAVFYRMVHP